VGMVTPFKLISGGLTHCNARYLLSTSKMEEIASQTLTMAIVRTTDSSIKMNVRKQHENILANARHPPPYPTHSQTSAQSRPIRINAWKPLAIHTYLHPTSPILLSPHPQHTRTLWRRLDPYCPLTHRTLRITPFTRKVPTTPRRRLWQYGTTVVCY
jgi:hypothetical protein